MRCHERLLIVRGGYCVDVAARVGVLPIRSLQKPDTAPRRTPSRRRLRRQGMRRER